MIQWVYIDGEWVFSDTITSGTYDPLKFSDQTASYTLALSDAGKVVAMDSASANNLTVPPNSDVAFEVGTEIVVVQDGAGTTTIVEGDGVTVNSRGDAYDLAGQKAYATLIYRGSDVWD